METRHSSLQIVRVRRRAESAWAHCSRSRCMLPDMKPLYASASSAVRLSPRAAQSEERAAPHLAALFSRCSRWNRGRGSAAVFSRLSAIAYAHARSAA